MMVCRICSTAVVAYLEKNGYEIHQCPKCGFGQVDVSQQEINEFYDRDYFDGKRAGFAQEENSATPPSHRFWIERQLAHLRSENKIKVLEIGPGLGGPIAGYFERERPEIEFAAVEISEYAADRLRSRGFTVYTGRITDPPILEACRGKFDLVFGTEVIEHDLDPRGFVRATHDVLKKDGWAAFTTGNLQGWMAKRHKKDWYYLDPPAHVSFYTPKSGRHVFASEGFSEIEVKRYGFRHIEMKLKTGLPGLLSLVHLMNISTGMSIGARKRQLSE